MFKISDGKFTLKQMNYFLYLFGKKYYMTGWKELDLENVYEHVYSIPTKVFYCDILIYTAINKSNDISRTYGKDRVRLVYRISKDNEYSYIKAKSFNKTPNLFYTIETRLNTLISRESVDAYIKSRNIRNTPENAQK